MSKLDEMLKELAGKREATSGHQTDDIINSVKDKQTGVLGNEPISKTNGKTGNEITDADAKELRQAARDDDKGVQGGSDQEESNPDSGEVDFNDSTDEGFESEGIDDPDFTNEPADNPSDSGSDSGNSQGGESSGEEGSSQKGSNQKGSGQESSGQESSGQESGSEENSSQENSSQENSSEEEGKLDDESTADDSEENSSKENSPNDGSSKDEEFDESGQLVSVDEIKDVAQEETTTVSKAAVIIKEAGGISDRLKDLARELIDREQGFDEEDEVSNESIREIYKIAFESLEDQANTLLKDGYTKDDALDPYQKAIVESFDKTKDSLAKAKEHLRNTLNYSIGGDFAKLKSVVMNDYINPSVSLSNDILSSLDIDGEVNLSRMAYSGKLSSITSNIHKWLTISIGSYIKEVSGGNRALLPVLHINELKENQNLTEKVSEGVEMASNEISDVYPGNKAMVYVGQDGADAILQFVQLERTTHIPREIEVKSLTKEVIRRLYSEMQGLVVTMSNQNTLIDILIDLVNKLEKWYDSEGIKDPETVKALRLEYFIPSVTIPVISLFYQTLTQFIALKAIVELSKQK